jgi:GxxExxY protein
MTKLPKLLNFQMRNLRHPKPTDALSRDIVGLAMKVHRALGSGFVETVYRNALAHELRNAEIAFECHPAISVMYEGVEVGIFQADLIVEGKLIVELKVASAISDEHCRQLVNYLTATKIEQGLLLNFGGPSLTFRTKDRIYKAALDLPDLHS